MIFSTVDLPEPFRPSTPILAPGKKDSDTCLRICRLGGTVLVTRFIVKTYCAITGPSATKGEWRLAERRAVVSLRRIEPWPCCFSKNGRPG